MAGTSCFWLLFVLVTPWQVGTASQAALNFTRRDFPRDFVFGASTSAYQYEGAVDEDGRSPSIWDTFTHAGRMPDNSSGDLGVDGYHKYKEDVELMSDTGLEAYRFSISWSRLIPRGRGPVNPKGLEYYNNVINELVKRGIEIHVTQNHLDFPQILEHEYHGWLSPRVVDDFTAYADVCFREFGDRVNHWTTTDEPNAVAGDGYDSGSFPPGRCSAPFDLHARLATQPWSLHRRPQLHPGSRLGGQAVQRQVQGCTEGRCRHKRLHLLGHGLLAEPRGHGSSSEIIRLQVRLDH